MSEEKDWAGGLPLGEASTIISIIETRRRLGGRREATSHQGKGPLKGRGPNECDLCEFMSIRLGKCKLLLLEESYSHQKGSVT